MEKDLYPPVRAFFEGLGYSCDGEVENMDLYMEKDGLNAAVEFKQKLDFRVVQQAALRQKVCDAVFIAVPQPGDLRSRAFRDKLYLLQRLGIGLIAVSRRSDSVKILSEPAEHDLSAYRTRSRAVRERVKKEFSARRLRNNTGGVGGMKKMTAYREDALLVLYALREAGGTAAPKQLAASSGVVRARDILYDDHYGWFTHPEKGSYGISPEGSAALTQYAEELRLLLPARASRAGTNGESDR